MFRNQQEAIRQILGHRLKEERLRKGWSLEETARCMGYTKMVAKGTKRIKKAEEAGVGGKAFLRRLADALGLDLTTIEREINDRLYEEREEWLVKWLEENPDSPVASHMIVRLFAGWYGPHQLPESILTPAQAVDYARSFAQRHRHEVCLPLTVSISVYFDTVGKIMFVADADLNLPSIRIE